LWYIHSGYVRTFSLEEDGTIIPLGFWSAGDLVGQTLSNLNPYEIECITDATATPIPRTVEVGRIQRMGDVEKGTKKGETRFAF
jgi:CRP-like cAMP-binding protein